MSTTTTTGINDNVGITTTGAAALSGGGALAGTFSGTDVAGTIDGVQGEADPINNYGTFNNININYTINININTKS